ncbi:hypothetical protein DL766_001858 [Monosporascus sp. MC13-8B]|uniref:Uncharacterized protein n=1 Tax=Monosporascus cannonballus TaxID=155416 RepID=A0ABY0HFS8_9PEZI|nr:hypothetical protein DL762_001789 [Monosporascus cannonballus]RYP36741.1 hypothetical protein DL766_001858 [Monosporascus sp. MC13-8B]
MPAPTPTPIPTFVPALSPDSDSARGLEELVDSGVTLEASEGSEVVLGAVLLDGVPVVVHDCKLVVDGLVVDELVLDDTEVTTT